MNCITKYKLKFKDLVIPARTKCKIINTPDIFLPNAPGEQLNIVINNFDINKENFINENEVIEHYNNVNDASLCGIVIRTNTQAVYLDAGAKEYYDYELYNWQLTKIFNEVPEQFKKDKIKLRDVIDYLDDEFSEWVKDNCEFYTVIESNNSSSIFDCEIGDKILNNKGSELFKEKQLEYKNKLETTGFTYEFTGGLY